VIDTSGNATAIWVENATYTIGTSAQSGNTITGTGTTFTSLMVGGRIVFANKNNANITAFTNATTLTVSNSLTVSNQAYTIFYNGMVFTSNLPNGGSWTTATQISTMGNNADAPKIAIDSNDVISAVWVETDATPNTVINYASYNGSWSSVVALSSSTGASSPSLSVDGTGNASNGNIAVAWVKNASLSSSVIEVAMKTSVASWPGSPTPNMSVSVAYSDHPVIATGNGYTTVVWHANPTQAQDQILAATASSIVGSFSTAVNITGTDNGEIENGTHFNYPKVTVDSIGNSAAIWVHYNLAGYDGTNYNTAYVNVYYQCTSLLANAGSWKNPSIFSELGQGINPRSLGGQIVSGFNGTVMAVMASSIIGNLYNIDSYIRTVGQTSMNTSEFISYNISSNQVGIATALALNQYTDVLVSYTYNDGTNIVIQVSETDMCGNNPNSYSAPSTISTASTDNSNPTIAMSITSGTINTVAVWVSYDSVNSVTIIQAATGSRSIIAPPTGLSVSQSSTTSFTRFDNTITWTSSTDPNATNTNLYRNGIFVISLPLWDTGYVDTNVQQSGITTTTYSVTTVDIYTQQSLPISQSI